MKVIFAGDGTYGIVIGTDIFIITLNISYAAVRKYLASYYW